MNSQSFQLAFRFSGDADPRAQLCVYHRMCCAVYTRLAWSRDFRAHFYGRRPLNVRSALPGHTVANCQLSKLPLGGCVNISLLGALWKCIWMQPTWLCTTGEGGAVRNKIRFADDSSRLCAREIRYASGFIFTGVTGVIILEL